MDYIQLLAGCDTDMLTILSVVKWVITWICRAVPILLIVLITIDVAKIVTAGKIDDNMKKEVGNKIVTRLIYALVIFLIPMLVSMIFRILPDRVTNSTGAGDSSWWSCWQEA